MRKPFTLLFLIGLSVGAAQAQQPTSGEQLTNANVITLTKAGLSPDILAGKIAGSTCAFDLSTNGLLALKQASVPDEVIRAMLAKGSSTAGPVAGNLPALNIANQPYLHNSTTNQWVPLEKGEAVRRVKIVGLGYGGSDMVYQVAGEKSASRLASTDSVVFWINTAGSAVPDLVLYRAVTDKKNRRATGVHYNTLGSASPSADLLVFNVLPAGKGLFRLVPAQKLPPGEYFFTEKPNMNTTSAVAYAFGID